MSMLAENRKKSKYSINPRGTYWSKDDDKFGQKLMEKFGWQKGKGLGANEDGRVENVKASSKNDSKGFGFKKTNNDNWISHQDDFNCLLSELNANHGRKESEEEKIISLEEKSKAAKKRVHYHKQAKGKDLSQRSTDELDCIFGRKKSKIPKEEKEILQSQETEATCEENMHGIQTIQSNQSVQEYFAMKLAQMKAKKNSARQREKEEEKEVDDDDEEDDDDDEDDGVKATVLPGKDEMEQDETGEVPASEETSEEIPKAMDSNEEEEEEEEEVVVVEKKERVGGEKIKKKKKKKSKDKEKARLTEEDEKKGEVTCTAGSSFGLAGVENGQDEAYHNYEILSSKKSKKSKRKKRSKESSTVAEAGEMKESVMEEVHPAEVSKMESGENSLATKTKKKKRDKKLKDETLEQEMNAAEAEEQDRPLFSDRAAHKPISETESEQVLEVISDEASVPMNEQVVVTGHKAVTVQRPKKSKKNKRLKDEAVEHAAIGQDVLDKSADFDVDASINTSSSSSRGSKGDNNDEETIASPPKKKKKKKSSKKSKSEVEDVEGEDEDEDDTASTLATTAADSSAGDKRTDSLIIQKHILGESRKLGPSPVLANSISLNTSVLVPKTPKEGIPENKHGIKRSPFAVSTATKIFQKAGANVDKICGYGNNLQ